MNVVAYKCPSLIGLSLDIELDIELFQGLVKRGEKKTLGMITSFLQCLFKNDHLACLSICKSSDGHHFLVRK